MKTLYLAILCFAFSARLTAQVNFTSSNLPVVVINTNGETIPDDPKITATMGIINNPNNARNNVSDPFNEYNGNIGIEVRGQTSQMFPMKSYSIELRDANGDQMNQSIFGMPSENDWVLYAPYNDKTLMRNVLAYNISNSLGQWAAHTKYVEVMLNGQYIGIYVFMEKIKRDKGRVNIKKLEPTDVTPDKITGGYIFSIDKQPDAWYSAYPAPVSNGLIHFKYEYPKAEDITDMQKDYIKNFTDSFETALHGDDFQDPQTGFRNYADDASFIDYFLVNEVSHDVDGYRISTFLHKDRNDINRKLFMGPVWDYDLSFRNANYCNGSDTAGWAYLFNNVCGNDEFSVPFWWTRFMQDTAFEGKLFCRWKEVRKTTLSNANLGRLIDSVVAVVTEAQQRHFAQWPVLGKYVWPNPTPIPKTYAGEIKTLKNWMVHRMKWLDENMPRVGACAPKKRPKSIITFTGKGNGVVNNLQWAADDKDVQGYEIEYSADGTVFNKAGYLSAGDIEQNHIYGFSHSYPITGNSVLYRLRVYDKTGNSFLSNTILVSKFDHELFTIIPNPGRGRFAISSSTATGRVEMNVFSRDGNQILSASGDVASLSAQLNNCLQNKTAGLYIVRLFSGATTQNIKVVLQ